jgi:hypothetical protein
MPRAGPEQGESVIVGDPGAPSARGERTMLRLGALAIVVSVPLGLVATAFHGGPDPGNLEATMPEYSANPSWVAVHLAQYVGGLLLLVAFFAVSRSIREGVGGALARLAFAVAVVAEAAWGVNQAVDAVAIKFVSEQWVAAPLAEKGTAFRIADAVRHVEIGTSSVTQFTLGTAVLLFGLAIAMGVAYPRLLGWSAAAIGAGLAAHGLDLALHGFNVAGALGVVGIASDVLFSIWTVLLAFFLWRKARTRVA